MFMELIILDTADDDLEKLSQKTRLTILDKIMLAKSGNKSNIKKLKNYEPKYRLRVGDYRTLFHIKK